MKREDFIKYAKENNLSQQKLAELIGIPQPSMWKYLNWSIKKPRSETLNKLKKFYDEFIKPKRVDVEISLPAEPKTIECKVSYEFKPKTQKVYLESVEDVIDELQANNEIFVESSTGHSIKLVSGFVVRYKDGGAISINAPILCSERYFVIKPIPLNLQVGKRYRAKKGSIVTIFNADETYFYGVIDGRKTIEVFRSNGECVSDDFNLVEEL